MILGLSGTQKSFYTEVPSEKYIEKSLSTKKYYTMTKNAKKWIKRNITDENRVGETAELYKSLGFEVKVVNFDPEKYPLECNECMKETPEKFKVILTSGKANMEQDLFDE